MQTINLQIAPTGVNPVIHVSQFDVGRQFKLMLYDGAAAYSLPEGTTARIDGIKPDKHGFSYTDAVSVSGNQVTITTKEQMTILSGVVECELRFLKDEDNIGTLNFKLQVETSPINESTDISDTDIPAIIDMGRQNMLNDEAWAEGTKDGVPVTSDDPQYENNAKYYADNAAYSASDANDSASDARDSKNAASASATLSESWAVGGTNSRTGEDTNNSKYYSEQADDSATAASTSESNAHDSELAAKLSEQNAKASEDILSYYASFAIPRFIIQNNRLYISNNSVGNFIIANNRLYVANPS